ncbi:LamG-like jellyroll fold domain-containing protein [Lentzea chajnantorensis]
MGGFDVAEPRFFSMPGKRAPGSRGRRAGLAGLVGVLVLTIAGPALAEVFPEALQRTIAAMGPASGPGQQWGDAAAANGDPAANRADPRSLQAEYQPVKGQDTPSAKDNPTEVVTRERGAVRGFDAATSKELADRRTETSRTFGNADGTETTEVSQEPINHRGPDGSWAPVDPSLVAAGGGWRNASDSVDIRLAAAADATPLVRYALDGDHELGFSLRGSAASAGQVSGSSVTYPAVQPRVDLRFDVSAGTVKESIVLHSADTPRTFDFPLHLKGLTPRISNGNLELTGRDGKVAAVVPAGFMVDAHDGPAGGVQSKGVRYELAGQVLRVTLDDAWLRDPARKYPVVVDPTVTTPESGHTMYVQRVGSSSNTSYSDGAQLRAGTVVDNGTRINAATYLDFSGIENTLRNHRIFGATLGLTNEWSYSCGARPVSVHPVTQGWNAFAGTYPYPGPAYGGELASSSFAYGYIAPGSSRSNCPQATAAIDLGAAGRDLVQRWVTGQQANYGLTVRASETDVYGWKKFYGHATANKPKLSITHTPYDAEYRFDRPVPKPALLKGGVPGTIGISVTNRGPTTWTPGEYVLSYRQFAASGAPMVQVNDSATLTGDVGRGQTVALEAKIFPPADWGEYTFEFSMHRKGHAYFVDEQIPPAVLNLEMQNVPPALQEQYPPNGYSAPTLRPTLWAGGIDIDNGGAGLQYRFKVCDKDNASSCVDSGYSANQSWTVPAGALRWSKTYLWNAFVKDSGGAESQPVQGSALLTAVPQPEITSHLGNAPYSGSTGEVDAQVGNYRTSAVDLSVGGVGPALGVSRTYNSLDPRRDLTFGAGWSTQFDMRVVEDTDGSGNAVVTYPDGQQVRFGHNGGGTYSPPPGRYATFFRNDSGWTLVDKNSTGYFFRPDGKLARIADNSGRFIDFTYDATTGRLTSAGNPASGRALTFTWTGDVVTQVSATVDGTELKWAYTYSTDLPERGRRLEEVCDPKGGCTTYSYGWGSHYRSTVLDTRPESYWTLGETDGSAKAHSQIGLNLGNDAATYTDVTRGVTGVAQGSPDSAVSFDGTKSRVTLPDNAIRKNRSVAVELWFKTTKSGPLAAFADKPFIENSAFNGMYVGTDGKLRARFTTTAATQPAPITTTGTVNDGQWHHVVLSADVATQVLYLDGAKVGEIAGNVQTAALKHGQLGAGNSSGPAWGAPQWFFQGEVDEVAVYAHPLGLNEVNAHVQAAKMPGAQVAKVTLPSGRVAGEVRYDTVRDRVSEQIDRNGGSWRFGAPAFTGNEQNPVRTVRVTDPGNRHHFYDFDPLRGRILRYLSPLGMETRKEDRPPGSTAPAPGEPTCAPQPDGSFCDVPVTGGGGFVNVEFQGVRNFSYDEAGFQTTITDEVGNQVVLAHDPRGNVKSRKTCRRAADCQVAHYTYYLNPADLTDPRNDKVIEHRDGRSAGATDNTYLTRYSYDPKGRLLEQVTADNASVKHTYTDGSSAAVGGGNEPAGLVKTSRDPMGAVTTYLYHRNGDVAEVRSPSGLRQVSTYDALGRKVTGKTISDAYPNGLLTTYRYDERSRLVRVTAPGVVNVLTGKTHVLQTSLEYDADGNQTRVSRADLTGGDPIRETFTHYDSRGRVERVVDAEGGEISLGYDSFGNTTFVVNADGVRTEFAYTARNAVSEVRLRGWNGDPEGAPALPNGYLVVQRNSYDRAGRLTRTTDAMNRTEVRDYYGDDLLFSRKLLGAGTGTGAPPKIDLETNSYDGAGNLVERRQPGNLVTKYTYDAVGRTLTTVDDPGGLDRRTAFAYNLNGGITQVTRTGNTSNAGQLQSGTAEVVDYGYDAFGRRTSEDVRLNTGRLRTTWEYDQRGLVRKVVPPRGNEPGASAAAFTTDLTYDEAGRLVGTTSPAVSVVTAENDPATVRPVTKIGYNAFGESQQAQDANGVVHRSEVDRLGRTVKSSAPSYTPPGASQPVEGFSTARYDGNGNVLETVDARGASTTFEYDQMGRVVKTTGPAGSVVRTYTRTGELLSTVDESGARTESTYDVFGRLATSTVLERSPAKTLTSTYSYNAANRLEKVRSPLGAESKLEYDVLGSLVRSTDPAGVVSSFGYDLAGRRIKVADGAGRATFTGYDQAGRVESVRRLSASGGLVSRSTFVHDAAGNLTTATDPLGRKTTYAHDALNRTVGQVEPVSDTESITTSSGYDSAGNRTRFVDGRGNRTAYTYNTLGLPESTIEAATAEHPAPADRTWTTTYNAAGDPVSERAPGGVVRTRTFDPLGRLTKETGSGAEAATTDRGYDYDALGRLVGSSSAGGTDTFTYNDRGLLLTSSGPGGTASREYDDDGNLTARTDASGTSRFTYLLGRTQSVQDGVTGLTQTFGYDTAGLLKTLDLGNGRTRTYDYDDGGRLAKDTVAGAASVAYTYDRADRVLTKTSTGTTAAGQQTYDYDHSGRLKSWTSPAGTVSYGWDAAGNRTRVGDAQSTYDERNRLRTENGAVVSHNARGGVTSRAGVTASFDAFDRMVSQGAQTYTYDALDRVTKRNDKSFQYSGTSSAVVSDGTAVYGRDASGSVLAIGQGTDKKLAVSDRHGDVVGTLDPAGTMTSLADSTAYDPFGVVTSGAKRAVGFQGEWTDPASGTVNMAARWYNPGSGGFESRDSWTLPAAPSGMANRYSYGLGSPVNHVDPTGHYPCKGFGGGNPCGDDSGGGLCILMPMLCSWFPGGGTHEDPGVGGSNQSSSNQGSSNPSNNRKNNNSNQRRTQQQTDPSVNARKQAQDYGRRNPLPVPEAMTQPSFSGDRKPPVSSAPDRRSEVASTYSNPVNDVNDSYRKLEMLLVVPSNALIGSVSLASSGPGEMTSVHWRQDRDRDPDGVRPPKECDPDTYLNHNDLCPAGSVPPTPPDPLAGCDSNTKANKPELCGQGGFTMWDLFGGEIEATAACVQDPGVTWACGLAAAGVVLAVIPWGKIFKRAGSGVVRLSPLERAASPTLTDLDEVAAHLGKLDHSPSNDLMIGRIRGNLQAGRPLPQSQTNFMRHELTESGLMQQGMKYEDAHELALKTHDPGKNYDVDIIDNDPSFGPWWRKQNGLPPRK